AVPREQRTEQRCAGGARRRVAQTMQRSDRSVGARCASDTRRTGRHRVARWFGVAMLVAKPFELPFLHVVLLRQLRGGQRGGSGAGCAGSSRAPTGTAAGAAVRTTTPPARRSVRDRVRSPR